MDFMFIVTNFIVFKKSLCENISEYKEAVIVYIAGYVVKMVRKKIQCPKCIDSLICSRSEAEQNLSYALLNRKRWGKLIDSSSDVILVCLETEKIFSVLCKGAREKIPTLSNISTKITHSILKLYYQKSN